MEATRQAKMSASSMCGASSTDARYEAIVLLSDDDEEEEEEYDAHDDDITLLPTRRSLSLSPSKSSNVSSSRLRKSESSSRKSPMIRLNEYILDVLDVYDMMPDQDSLKEYFTGNAKHVPEEVETVFVWSNESAVLRIEVLGKLVSLLRSCSSPQSHSSVASSSSTGGSSIGQSSDPIMIENIDMDDMSRLIKILVHSLDVGRHLDPYSSLSRKRTAPTPPSTARSKRIRSSSSPSKSSESRILSDSTNMAVRAHSDVPSNEENELRQVGEKLGALTYSASVAHCTLTLLNCQYTDSSLCCDETILACIQVLRSIVLNGVLPFVQVCSGTAIGLASSVERFVSALGTQIKTESGARSKKDQKDVDAHTTDEATDCRRNMNKSVEILQSALFQLCHLTACSDWKPSDASLSVILSCIVPALIASEASETSSSKNSGVSAKVVWTFFTSTSSERGSLISSIRIPALNILQTLYPQVTKEQQAYMIDTILDHLGDISDSSKTSRRKYNVGNGKSINMISALLLQLIQGSARIIEFTVEQPALDILPSASQQSATSNCDQETRIDVECLRHQLDEPREVARQVADGLISKVKASKLNKTSGTSDTALGPAVETITNDILNTLFLPSWPAASLLLSQMSRLFCATLDDRQSTPEMKGSAIEFLGFTCARLQESQVRMRSLTVDSLVRSNNSQFDGTTDIGTTGTANSLIILEKAYERLIAGLQRGKSLQTSPGAIRFMKAHWAVEVAQLHRKTTEKVEAAVVSESEGAESSRCLSAALTVLDECVKRMTKSDSVMNLASPVIREANDGEEGAIQSIQELFETVVQTFNYMIPCEFLHKKLIEASSGPVAGNRSKALRALSMISQADEDFLRQQDVRLAVQRCLLDESVNVRDSAVGLLGRFVIANPTYIEQVFPSLRTKIEDTGLLVRKRALRLLGDMYRCTSSEAVRAEAAMEIVRSVNDEEESMQDLAISISAEMWFTPLQQAEKTKPEQVDQMDVDQEEKAKAHARGLMVKQMTSLIWVVDRISGRPSALETLLDRLKRNDRTRDPMKRQIDTLVDELVSSVTAEGADQLVVGTSRILKTIALLVHHQPSALSISHAKALLSFVHSGQSQTEVILLGHLLDIYRNCLPEMRKMALSFARRLQDLIRPMISQPSPYLPILPELVRCYAAVITHQTKDHAILVKTLQQCHRLLCKIVSQARSRKVVASADRNDAVVIRLTSLLVEAVDFDQMRKEVPEMVLGIDEVTRRPIKDEVMTLLIRLLDNQTFVPHALYGMRFLVRAFPKLILNEDVQGTLLSILAADGLTQEKAIILRSLADVLHVEEARKMTVDQAKEFGELVGNTESLANPISFEIMQIYLKPALQLTSEPALRSTILELLQHIIMRGMCHPLECLPSLIALETLLDSPQISAKAQVLHRHLIGKAGANISFRYAICARVACRLHTVVQGPQNVRGALSGARSCFQAWYDTIVEHQARSARIDMLKALIKAFDVRTATWECEESDVHFARFIAEALSALEFKLADEVQYVVDQLQAILDVAGEHVRVFAMEEVEIDGEEEGEEEELDPEEIRRVIAVGRMATILSFALLLREHLETQFGISAASIGRSSSPSSPSSTRASNRAAARKLSRSVVSWAGLPGADPSRQSSYRLGKRELGYFENLVEA